LFVGQIVLSNFLVTVNLLLFQREDCLTLNGFFPFYQMWGEFFAIFLTDCTKEMTRHGSLKSQMVPMARLELARPKPPPPQDGVSTNSTTSAKLCFTLTPLTNN